VIVADVIDVTALPVLTVNVTLLEGAWIGTVGGTLAKVLLLDTLMVPPGGGGAWPFNVTVAVEVLPPMTLVGLSANEDRAAGVTVSVAFLVTVPYVAEIPTPVEPATPVVVTGKVALLKPAAIVTVPLSGTAPTRGLLLDRLILAPPTGAGPARVTVPVEGFPPTMLVGLKLSDARPGVTVSVAIALPPAVTVTVVVVVTEVVLTLKFALLNPAETRTLGETLAAALLLERLTDIPPIGAGPFSVTVPVEGLPATTDVGLNVTDDTVGGFTVSCPARPTLLIEPEMLTNV